MAGAAGGRQQVMRGFVTGLFRGSPDLSILTHAIVRKKYLDHVGQENLSKEEKEQLKRLVEEELVQMKVDEPPGNVELSTEVQDSFKSGDRKRPHCISDTSDEEIKNEQEQKRQRIEKKLEVSSDEKDSGIDSKKQPLRGGPKLLRKFSGSSDQGDSGAEDHTAESGSDEESTKSKGKEPLQEARRERQRGSKTAKGQWNRGPQDRIGSKSEEATDTGQSDLEEEVEEHRKVTKGNSLKQRNLKLRKKVVKELKATDLKEKNRKMNEQRAGKNKSEGEDDLSEEEEISEKKRIKWSESEEEKKSLGRDKARGRVGQGTQKGSKGNESKDASGSDSDKKCRLQKKMANRQCRRKSRNIEDSGSSSDSAGQSPVRKEGARRASGERWDQEARNDPQHKRQPKERGRKKMPREDLSRKELEEEKKRTRRIQESRRSTSEESESGADEPKSLKEKRKKTKGMQDSTGSDGESQSEETEESQGQPMKGALRSPPLEGESDESEDGDRRENRMLKKKGKGLSGSESSQEEEKLKNRRAQKLPRKSVSEKESALDSEDSGSELGGKRKSQSWQKRTEKLRRRSTSKEKHGEESFKEEDSSTEGGMSVSSNQHHLGKDKKHHSGKNEEHPSIQRLKRYIRECGVRRNYKKLLAGCRSRRAQIEVLREELGSLGMKGTPSLAKCKALKQKREEAAEVASLDINNIIATEGRPKRRNVWSLYSKPQESPSSPEELPVRRHTTDWSHLRGVISSDGESS